jgi:hypothetical protein
VTVTLFVAATAPALCRRYLVSLCALRRALTTLVATAVLAGGGGALSVLATPAYADGAATYESQFVAKTNGARQSAGMSSYSVASDLVSIARAHSADMARSQTLYHNPSLTSQVQNWQAVGENVGEGPNVDDIHTAFMNSPEHRANILDHDFTQVGVGVSVDKNGTIWVTQDFRQPMTSSTSTSSGSSSGSHSSSPSTTPSSSTASTPTYSAGTTATPQPVLSPRAQLELRLQELKQDQRGDRRPSDPVAQAFDYVDTLSRLAG